MQRWKWQRVAMGVLLLAVAAAATLHCAAPRIDAPAPPPPGTIPARVTRVVDGDTLDVLHGGATHRIRLAEIDAPESQQPWGREATVALQHSVSGGDVALEIVDTDRYGRWVAKVYVRGTNVNHAMVRDGHAWAYTEYAKDVRVIEYEDMARSAERGLWSLAPSEREAPWAWRRARRGGGAPVSDDPRCTKRRCSEMSDCADARFHLETCGVRSLDGDGDGVPCEALCAGAR